MVRQRGEQTSWVRRKSGWAQAALTLSLALSVGCDDGESKPVVLIVDLRMDAANSGDGGTSDAGSVEDAAVESQVGAACERADGNLVFDADCEGACVPQRWTCDADREVCQGYCTVECTEAGDCPDGFTCRSYNRRRPEEMHCLSDAPLGGEFEDVLPADGVEFIADSGANFSWTYRAPQPDQVPTNFEFEFGEAPDRLDETRSTLGSSARPNEASVILRADDLEEGREYYWRAVAIANGGLRAYSEVRRFTTSGDQRVRVPCPDQPTVEIAGRDVETVEIDGQCWTRGGFAVGRAARARRVHDDGAVEHIAEQGTFFYTWWELHNDYPGDWPIDVPQRVGAGPVEPDPQAVEGSAVCPDGWRLPTRAQWRGALEAGNARNPMRQTSAIDYQWVGVVLGDPLEICEVGDGILSACGQMGELSNLGTDYSFFAADRPSTTSARAFHILRPERDGLEYTESRSNAGTPRNAHQVRCVRD